MKSKIIVPLLFIFAAILLFCRLGDSPLFEPDEGRYAAVSWEMNESGDYLTPHKNGFVHFHKPPITYQLMALSQKVVGSNEWGVRLPGVLFALGILFLVYALAKMILDRKTAILSAVILLTTPLFLFMARLATTDIGLLFWVTLGIYAFVKYRREGSKAFLLLSYLGLGLAFSTKGPVALLLYLSAVLSYSIIMRSDTKRSNTLIFHILGIAVFLISGFAWYLWAVLNNPDLVNYFLFFQTAERVSSDSHHPQTIFYYLPFFIVLLFPWSFFAPGLIAGIFGRKSTLSVSDKKLGLWFLVWGAIIFVFFSAIPSKLASYLLPIAVPTAIGAALYLSHRLRCAGNRQLIVAYYFISFIFIAAGIALGVYVKFFLHARLVGFSLMFYCLAFVMPLAGLVLLFFSQERKAKAYLVSLAAGLFLVFAVFYSTLPEIGTYKNIKPFAMEILRQRHAGEPVILYRKSMLGVPFYLKERVIEIATKTDLRFTPKDEQEGYFYENADEVGQYINGSRHCFILSKTSDARELEEKYSGKLYRLMEGNKIILYSNQQTSDSH